MVERELSLSREIIILFKEVPKFNETIRFRVLNSIKLESKGQ